MLGTDVKTAFDYVEEIFGLGTINVASKNYSYSAKNDIAAMENGEEMSETRYFLVDFVLLWFHSLKLPYLFF